MRRQINQLGFWGGLLGVRCEICGKRERERNKLELHHIDGNIKNNVQWNLAYAHKVCHSSLTRLNGQYVQGNGSRGRSEMNVRERESVDSHACLSAGEVSSESEEVRLNKKMRPLWYAWLYEKVEREIAVTTKSAVFDGAKYLREMTGHGSAVTTRRYLGEETNELGAFYLDMAEDGSQIVKLRRKET
jgi:hypothetical protein